MNDHTITAVPGLNVPLLRKTIEWAHEQHDLAARGERSEWDQGTWCGTSCCIAGKIALHEGWTYHPGDYAVRRNGVLGDVPLIATKALGVRDCRDVYPLFSGLNTIKDLYRIANRISGGEIEIPPGMEQWLVTIECGCDLPGCEREERWV